MRFDIALGVAIAFIIDALDKQVVDWDVVEDSVDLNEPLVVELNDLTCEFLVGVKQALLRLLEVNW